MKPNQARVSLSSKSGTCEFPGFSHRWRYGRMQYLRNKRKRSYIQPKGMSTIRHFTKVMAAGLVNPSATSNSLAQNSPKVAVSAWLIFFL